MNVIIEGQLSPGAAVIALGHLALGRMVLDPYYHRCGVATQVHNVSTFKSVVTCGEAGRSSRGKLFVFLSSQIL